jgi:hypothetical protein
VVNYPLVVAIGDGQMVVGNSSQFLARYDDIMTGPVVRAIDKTDVRNVRVISKGITLGSGTNHMVNYTDMAIGNDRIWFDLVRVEDQSTPSCRILIRMVNAAPLP